MVRCMDYTGLSAEQIAQTMTEKQLTYVQNKIAGHTVQECVVLAGYKLHKGQENARHHGDYMNLKMKAYEKAVMEKVAKEAEAKAVLTGKERREFLASVVRTPIGKLDENSPLVQSIERRTTPDGGESVKITMSDKLKAAELDAKLTGELSNGGTSVSVSFDFGGLFKGLPDTRGLPSHKGTVVEVKAEGDEE